MSSLIDAAVRVRGVASSSFNRKGQMVAPVFRVANISLPYPGGNARTNEWLELPLKRISQILVFSPQLSTASHSGAGRGNGLPAGPKRLSPRRPRLALKVETSQPTDYLPGDFINVTGFPVMSPYSAELRHAVCQQVGRQAVPLPPEPPLEEVLGGLHDAELIRLRAKLLDCVVDDDGIAGVAF